MNKKGFTLIELIAIIIIFAAICLVSFTTIINMSKESEKTAYTEYENTICLAAKTYVNNNDIITADKNEYEIQIKELINKGFLKSDIKDPKTDNELTKLNKNITITVNDDKSLSCSTVKDSITYIVKFDSNGGKGTMASQTFVYGEAQKLTKNAFTKMGYHWLAWTGDNGESYGDEQLVSNLTSKKDEIITLSAYWEANIYNVEFDFGIGTGRCGSVSQISISYGSGITLPQCEGNGVDSHTFAGWNTKSDGTGVDIKDGDKNLTSEDGAIVTLYAKWLPTEYNVTFDSNGGEGTMTSQTFVYGEAQKLTKNTFTKSNYKFKEWNTEKDGTGTSYADEAEIQYVSYVMQTLYAQWEPVEYNVTFDSNGGEGSMTSQTFKYSVSQKLTPNRFSKKGYRFVEWNTKSDGTGESYTNGEKINIVENTTLFARWTEGYEIGEVVYFDVLTGYKCTNYSKYNSNTDYNGVTGATNKEQNSCLKFYVFNDDGDTVNLILDHNTTNYVKWNESGKNSDGPTTILSELKSDTASWQGTLTPSGYSGYKARLITVPEIAKITGLGDDFDGKTPFYFDSNTETPSTTCTEGNTTGCNYGWLYDRTNSKCKTYGCYINLGESTKVQGYWTATANSDTTDSAWAVGYYGRIASNKVMSKDAQRGVRPVIEVEKTSLNITKNADPVCKAVKTSSVGNVPTGNYVAGDEYTCQVGTNVSNNFYVLSTSGENVTLIMKGNLDSNGKSITSSNPTAWCNGCHYENAIFFADSSSSSAWGKVNVKTVLENRTYFWNRLSSNKIGLPSSGFISAVAKKNCSNCDEYGCYICDSIKWLKPTPLPTTTADPIYGYWLEEHTSSNTVKAYSVYAYYYEYDYMSYTTTIPLSSEATSNTRDIRPVITLTKDQITQNSNYTLSTVSAQSISALTGSVAALISQ